MTEGREGYDLKQCAKCRAWIPGSASMCAYCNTSTPDEPPGRSAPKIVSLRHGFSVTRVLIVANLAYFVFSLVVQYLVTPKGNPVQWMLTGTGLNHGLHLAGAYEHGEVVKDGQWWRVLCAAFLHIGGIHIALNMMALAQLGDLAEKLFGPAKFLTVYVVSGVSASLAGSVWYSGVKDLPPEQIPGMAGASGAIFGIAGLLIIFLLRAGTDRGRAIAWVLAKNVALMLAFGFVVTFISQTGHVGGLLPGLLFGLLLRDDFGGRRRPQAQRFWNVAAIACVVAIAASLAAGVFFAVKSVGEIR